MSNLSNKLESITDDKIKWILHRFYDQKKFAKDYPNLWLAEDVIVPFELWTNEMKVLWKTQYSTLNVV